MEELPVPEMEYLEEVCSEEELKFHRPLLPKLVWEKPGPLRTQCWVWIGPRYSTGYGYWKGRRAHQIFFEYYNWPIDTNMILCHKCNNPSCVNPDHLYEGTHQDNSADRMGRNRYV